MHFGDKNDILIEILRREELLLFFRHLNSMKRTENLKFKYSDNFDVVREGQPFAVIINQKNNFYVVPHFKNSKKVGYLLKWSSSFFSGEFKEKLVIISDCQLTYFDNPQDELPKRQVSLVNSKIVKIVQKEGSGKYCFSVELSSSETMIFSAETNEEMEDWMEVMRKAAQE